MKLYTKIVYFAFAVFLLNAAQSSYGQKMKNPENLPRYDHAKYHFGFTLGFNSMDFAIRPVENYNLLDSLCIIESKPEKGFDIGIVSNLRLTEYLDLRFIPSLSFGDRSLTYKIIKSDSITIIKNKKVESTYIEFPFYIKYKSARFFTDVRAYVLAGAKYNIDLASQSHKKEESDEIMIKLIRHDILYQVGVGFDFYLHYFKFSVELKMAYGTRNILEYENNIYTNGIDRLNSKIFYISFNFE